MARYASGVIAAELAPCSLNPFESSVYSSLGRIIDAEFMIVKLRIVLESENMIWSDRRYGWRRVFLSFLHTLRDVRTSNCLFEAVVAADVDGYALDGNVALVATAPVAVRVTELLCFGGGGFDLRIC
jgi:hypothetical protein